MNTSIITTLTESILPSHRYAAYIEGNEEAPHGFGSTPANATDDLMEQIEVEELEQQEAESCPEL